MVILWLSLLLSSLAGVGGLFETLFLNTCGEVPVPSVYMGVTAQGKCAGCRSAIHTQIVNIHFTTAVLKCTVC